MHRVSIEPGRALVGPSMFTLYEVGTVKDGEASFEVTRERQGQKFTLHYRGKVSADNIKGKIEVKQGDQTRSFDWMAKREKAEK